MDWFLNDNGLRQERIKGLPQLSTHVKIRKSNKRPGLYLESLRTRTTSDDEGTRSTRLEYETFTLQR